MSAVLFVRNFHVGAAALGCPVEACSTMFRVPGVALGIAELDSRRRLSPRPAKFLLLSLPSLFLRNRRSLRIHATRSAAAPADWRVSLHPQPLPLLYRKMCPLRGECVIFLPVHENNLVPL